MERPRLSPALAIAWGGLGAGVLDIGAVFAFWAARDVASSVLGRAAFELGAAAAALGLFLHFAVSYTFASAYVVASARWRALRSRPIVFGIAYGVLAYGIMTFVVVPCAVRVRRLAAAAPQPGGERADPSARRQLHRRPKHARPWQGLGSVRQQRRAGCNVAFRSRRRRRYRRS